MDSGGRIKSTDTEFRTADGGHAQTFQHFFFFFFKLLKFFPLNESVHLTYYRQIYCFRTKTAIFIMQSFTVQTKTWS